MAEVANSKMDEILSYLKSRGAHRLADLIATGKFHPNMEKWSKHLNRILQIQTEGRVSIESTKQQEERQVSILSPNKEQETVIHSGSGIDALRHELHQISASNVYRNALSNIIEHQSDIRRFIVLKWKDIKSEKRVYALSPGKKYEVQVSIKLLRRIGITLLEFCQRDINRATVDVNFVMRTDVVFHCALEASENFRADHRLMNCFPVECRSGYRLLLHLATVVHYADLVIPMQQEQSERPLTHSTRSVKEPENTISDRTVTKYIPRLTRSDPTGSGKGWPTKASSFVDPHRRRLPFGQKPSFHKIIEADQFGINLQGPSYPDVQYTFVKGHARGGDHPPDYLYKQDYRAVRSLESILDVLGFPL